MKPLETIRGLVRPVVTVLLVAAFCVACFVDDSAAKLLGPPMGIVLGFWFNDRTKKQ